MAHPGWQSPHSVSRVTVPAWASSLPRGLQREWGWHGLEPHEAEKVPGGQDLHNVPCPRSCGRERVRTKPGARPEVPGKPAPALKSLPRTGQMGRVSSPSWAPPRAGTAKGSLVWPEARAAPGRAAGRARLRGQEAMASLGLSIYHPRPNAPGVGTTHHTGPLSPASGIPYDLTSIPHAASKACLSQPCCMAIA